MALIRSENKVEGLCLRCSAYFDEACPVHHLHEGCPYQKLVASVAWRYGTPRQEIEDVVSEVFIKAYNNLHQYRPEHAFSTWL